jgi:hypothetical protein
LFSTGTSCERPIPQYYDIVVQNVDQSPSVNWSSLDFLWDAGFDNQTPDVQVWLRNEGGAFKPGDGGSFIGSPVALFYADGAIQGHGDIAVSSTSASWLQCGSAYGFPAGFANRVQTREPLSGLTHLTGATAKSTVPTQFELS